MNLRRLWNWIRKPVAHVYIHAYPDHRSLPTDPIWWGAWWLLGDDGRTKTNRARHNSESYARSNASEGAASAVRSAGYPPSRVRWHWGAPPVVAAVAAAPAIPPPPARGTEVSPRLHGLRDLLDEARQPANLDDETLGAELATLGGRRLEQLCEFAFDLLWPAERRVVLARLAKLAAFDLRLGRGDDA
jgi:hypothetical protein